MKTLAASKLGSSIFMRAIPSVRYIISMVASKNSGTIPRKWILIRSAYIYLSLRHFLTECPAYDIERKELQNGCRNYDLPLKVLLATAEGMKATIEYVQHTKRFKKPFGSFEGDLVAPRRAAVLREKREHQEEKKRRKEEKKGR